jgi:hypothetical protein
MSFLAIGAVTQSMTELLTKKLNKPPLLGTSVTLRVTTLPPDDDRIDTADGVNLFLYRVSEDPFGKNDPWRGDRDHPNGSKRPPLSLVLHYLLTAYAKKGDAIAQDDITAHRILGNAMAIFHEYPVLNDVHDADFDADLVTQFADELRKSFERIKVSLAPLSMEDFSKIWTGLGKAHRLSVAYEVSLVQIAPIVPAPSVGPPVQQIGLEVTTLGRPIITAVEPPSGPVGTTVTLRGSGFVQRGRGTNVTVADTALSATDLALLTEDRIVLTIPEAPQRGPELPIIVTAAGLDSAPATYRVEPWIERIQPLRGVVGIPLTIPFVVPSGETAAIEIDGQAVATTTLPGGFVTGVVPTTIASNGAKGVVVTLAGPPVRRSNTRFYEVLPAIHSVNVVATASPVSTTVTVDGVRLAGAVVTINYGALALPVAATDVTANQVKVTVNRTLPANQSVTVMVDGRASNPLPRRLSRIEPDPASPGGSITLFGAGLSGQNVGVRFGATTIAVGAHPIPSQLRVTVPSGLAPGTVQVKATVDGNDTGTVPLQIVP